MEHSREFLLRESEKPKTADDYEKEELRAELGAFTGRERAVLEKDLSGHGLSKDEERLVRNIKAAWWQNKYDRPYSQKHLHYGEMARRNAPPEELKQAADLQQEFFSAAKRQDAAKLEQLKRRYEEQYPDQLEGVEALFGMLPFLRLSERLHSGEPMSEEERTQAYQELTQYQYLITHFVEQNGGDREFLQEFWSALERAATPARQEEFGKYRRGVVTQVATMKIFQALGKRPTLSHPKEDAFHKIDMWTESQEAVQIKGSYFATEAELVPVPHDGALGMPAVAIDKESDLKLISSDLFDEAQRFKVKVREYERELHRSFNAYFLVVPNQRIDTVTGEPDEETVRQVRQQLDRIEGRQEAA